MCAGRWRCRSTCKNVGFNSMNGQFRASALPMPDTQITRPAFFAPLQQWLNDLKLSDGYQPWNPNFGAEMVKKMTDAGHGSIHAPDRRCRDPRAMAWASGSTTRLKPKS